MYRFWVKVGRMKPPKTIRSLFALPGFVPVSSLGGVFGDRYARVIVLRRRKKLLRAPSAVIAVAAGTTEGPVEPGICRYPAGGFISNSSGGESTAPGASVCTWNGSTG